MQRPYRFAAATALALAAGACAPSTGQLSAVNNPSLYSVHQPVVERTDYVLDLTVSGDRLAPSERERLGAWLAGIGVGYGDLLSVDEPGGYASGARADVAAVADNFGLFLADGAPVTQSEIAPGTIRVVASRASASVPSCPDWAGKSAFSSSNTSSNFGCSTNSNLAAMIANPEDLVRGQDGSTQGSATTASRAVRTYRERVPTGRQPLPSTTTTQGNQ